MSKDVVVVVSRETIDPSADSLDILLISTKGVKDAKTYTTLEDVKKDWTEETTVYQQAAAMMGQGKARPVPASLLRKIKVVGLKEPESAEELIQEIREFQETDNNWYLFLTDRTEEEYITALGQFARDSEPSAAELAAGVEDHRKFYFAQTASKIYKNSLERTAVIYTEKLEEHADAAWVGAVGPWYPQSVTWKFKMPAGISVPALKAGEINLLEENHVNFVTNEYKKNYIKNGCCLNGEWIDAVLGGDWISLTMREKLYSIFMNNPVIPYTDAGFTMVAAGVFETLDQAADYGIIAKDPGSGAGIYQVTVPKRSRATDEQAAARQMPDILWEAQLSGAVHGIRVQGILKVSL